MASPATDTLPQGPQTVTAAERIGPEPEPAAREKQRCVGEEKRQFQDKWTYAYYVVPHGSDTVMCLICKQVNAMLKDFNIKRHYDTNFTRRGAPQ